MSDAQLYLPDAVRRIDATAIEHCGIPGYELMRRAAGSALQVLRERWPQARRLFVLAGGGNNGGDGVDLARQAIEGGFEVQLLLLGAPVPLPKPGRRSWRLADNAVRSPRSSWTART